MDAKYKNLNGAVDREDSLQMLAYMLRFSAAKALLLYPVKEQSQPAVLDLIQGKNCPSRQVIVFPFEIPACNRDDTFAEFTEKMKMAEESLQVLIGSVVS